MNSQALAGQVRPQLQIRPELPDYLRPGLDIVFVGFNPGDMSSRLGRYYAWPRNQFWDLLFRSGLLPERLRPEDDHRVTEFGLGLTDIVKRWSTSASDLRMVDYREGIPRLRAKLLEATPRVVAFNGKGVYEKFSGHPAKLGWQRETFGKSKLFVLPSTSPANAVMPRAAKLRYFRRLARFVMRTRARGASAAGLGPRPASGRGGPSRPSRGSTMKVLPCGALDRKPCDSGRSQAAVTGRCRLPKGIYAQDF